MEPFYKFFHDVNNPRYKLSHKMEPYCFRFRIEYVILGGLSVAVPSELRGYWTLYKKFGGGVPWKALIEPTISMCRDGIYVTKFLEKVFKQQERSLMADSVLR